MSCCQSGRPTREREGWNRERRGSREVRDRNGAHALQGVPGHRFPVLLRRGDGAPLLPGQFGRRHPRNSDGEIYFEVRMSDAWVWDMYRPARFVKNVRVLTFKDVNVEELDKPDLRLPGDGPFGS